jgi:hypothetical protein
MYCSVGKLNFMLRTSLRRLEGLRATLEQLYYYYYYCFNIKIENVLKYRFVFGFEKNIKFYVFGALETHLVCA